MTTKSVPQKDPPKTWATYTFTVGYPAKPQTYKQSNRHKEAIRLFNLPKKREREKKKKKKTLLVSPDMKGFVGVFIVYLKKII